MPRVHRSIRSEDEGIPLRCYMTGVRYGRAEPMPGNSKSSSLVYDAVVQPALWKDTLVRIKASRLHRGARNRAFDRSSLAAGGQGAFVLREAATTERLFRFFPCGAADCHPRERVA